MSAITAKASRKMKKYAVLTREPRCFLGSFDFSWEQRKLGDVVKEITRNDPESEAPIMMITANNGFIEQSERYAFNNAGESLKKYILLKKGELAYNHGASKLRPYGSCFALTTAENARIPFVYHCFSAENQNAEFMSIELNGAEIENQLRKIVSSGARMDGLLNISFDEYTSVSVLLPGTEEQDRIADFFRHLDNLITLHQRKCALLFSPFQAFISMMFTTSTFSWEQRKFGEVFDCTVPNNTLSRAELSYDEGTVLNVHYGDVLIKYGSVLDVQKDDIPRIPHRCREDFNGALLQDGDIIIADTAEDETTGKACEISNLQGSVIVSGLHTMVCRPRNRMALGYLGYYLNSNAYHHQLLPLMQGIKVLSLSRSNIQKTSVSYPTAVKEQQHIAYYFSQLDNLITLHQRKCIFFTGRAGRLISTVNKKRITSSWEQRKFEEIAVRSSVICSDDTLPRVEYEDIVSGTGRLNKDIYAKQSSKSGIVFHQGDVLYGKLRPYLQNWLLPTFDGLAVGDFWVLQPQNADSSFLYRLIQSRQFDEVANQSTGTKMPRADWKLVSKTVFSIPSNISEQAAIGTYFTALDSLITLHQRKPFLMKWRTSDANRNQTNRLVL